MTNAALQGRPDTGSPLCIDRRNFVRGGAMLVAAGMGRFAFGGLPAAGSARLRVGILSDIHVYNPMAEGRGFVGIEMVEKAFRYFRDRNVDAVIIAGDMADTGQRGELLAVGDAWRKVFRDNVRADGGRTEKVFVFGNHDIEPYAFDCKRPGFDPDKARPSSSIGFGDNRAKFWREAFDEEYAPMYVKNIKGYRFVGIQYREFDRKGAVAAFLEAHRAELAGTRPFFYAQHFHPKGTCSAPWTWGQDSGNSTAALKAFPNAVSFTGHSHTPLTDDRTLWRGEFTSVGTASLKYLIPFGGRENSRIFLAADAGTQQMPFLGCEDGHHGQVMTVYDDRIVLERRDFENDLPVGPDWIIPLPAEAASFAKRGESAAVPQFAADAKVSVSRIDGKNRRGEPTKQVVVAFPNVRGLDGGARAFDYEVRVEATEVDRTKTWMTKRVYSPHYYWAAEKDDETVICLFAVSELPAPNGEREPGRGTTYRFAVSPANAFGGQGRAIYSGNQI